jgi:hypothetical protein
VTWAEGYAAVADERPRTVVNETKTETTREVLGNRVEHTPGRTWSGWQAMRRQARRNVGHAGAVGRQPGSQRTAKAGRSFDRPGDIRPAAGEPAQLPVAVTADLDADGGQGLQARTGRDSGPGTPCADRSR